MNDDATFECDPDIDPVKTYERKATPDVELYKRVIESARRGRIPVNMATKMAAIASAGALVLGLAGCGDDEANGDQSSGASVNVALFEIGVTPDPTSVDAGNVEIVADNVGADVHELLIVKGDDPAALPVDEDGVVIEDDLPEGDLIGEIPSVDPGTEESASFDLDAGNYLLICNLLAATAPPRSHFQDGMVNTLTVN